MGLAKVIEGVRKRKEIKTDEKEEKRDREEKEGWR